MKAKNNHTTIGPVQVIAIGFKPDSKFEGKILEELEKLDRMKTIRILDLLFVMKDKESSDILALSVQGEEMGAIVGALMGFEFDGQDIQKMKSQSDEDNHAFGLKTEDIENIGDSLEPGMAAGILLIEHVWARDLKKAIRGAGGVPIAEGFLTPEALSKVAFELESITEIMDSFEDAKKQEEARISAYN